MLQTNTIQRKNPYSITTGDHEVTTESQSQSEGVVTELAETTKKAEDPLESMELESELESSEEEDTDKNQSSGERRKEGDIPAMSSEKKEMGDNTGMMTTKLPSDGYEKSSGADLLLETTSPSTESSFQPGTTGGPDQKTEGRTDVLSSSQRRLDQREARAESRR